MHGTTRSSCHALRFKTESRKPSRATESCVREDGQKLPVSFCERLFNRFLDVRHACVRAIS